MLPNLLFAVILAQCTYNANQIYTGFSSQILSLDYDDRKDAIAFVKNNLNDEQKAKIKYYIVLTIYLNPIKLNKYTPLSTDQQKYSPRQVGLAIISNLSDKDMIPCLLDHLDYMNDYQWKSISSDPTSTKYIAVRGLIKIGKPAVQPCLREIAMNRYEGVIYPMNNNRGENRLRLALYVIHRILGREKALETLHEELNRLKWSDPRSANNIHTAIKVYSSSPSYSK